MSQSPISPNLPSTEALLARLGQARERIMTEVGKVVVGQDLVLEQMLIALLCRGHCLLEGVPGLAKTVMVQTLGRALELGFGRIQFTPDLMPTDITGTDILQEDPQTGRRQFEFLPGPLFSNLLLADEVNRTPPKTQAALLEAMQERRVTVRGRTYELPDPFCVLATQNPIEQEGTYNLPEAQLDRFMFRILVDYPSISEEREILRRTTGKSQAVVTPVFTAQEVLSLQELIREVPVADHVVDHALDLVRATRPNGPNRVAGISDQLRWGAGPRAGQMLILGAKALAVLRGRFHASAADIDLLAGPVLRHRIVLTFAAQAEGATPDTIITRLVEHCKARA